ncbi:TonB-dependent receptor [Luteimonas sp. BDR2-5]|uniref:TonB-dependent receptor n=1 Tax=Proluteimonas luteida TaxID=2878685 RepID=UPI001E2D3B00|nr:TonB-dependent receptor [Luteimonas sp. BDR2-5]MCD9026701.1 TonB-dependent receptor [Luteimonas sp. BDR2-5]
MTAQSRAAATWGKAIMRKTTRQGNGTGTRAARAYLCYTALAVAIGVCLPVYAASAQASAAEATVRFDIPSGDLAGALERFSTQSGIQLLYRNDLVAGKRARAVTGVLTPGAALQRLLEGSGVETEQTNETTFVLKPAATPAAAQTPATPAVSRRQNAAPEEVQELERLTVTGTRIRGGTTPSPTIVLDEQQFQQEGFTDLGEVIRSIPQNFRGGQNPGVVVGSAVGNNPANNNQTGGSALNLRGLGPDATLTLLNGRRLSYDGIYQAVDISAIPIEAVERVEIVPDGASAIYGSDAVGGVANVILKRDFDGVSLGALYGDSSDGGLRKHDYTATAGASWESGGLIATLLKSSHDPIYSNQRDYAQSMDDPSTLYNGRKLRSSLVSAHQRFGERAELRLDALRTVREASDAQSYPTYHFLRESESTVTLVAPSLEVTLPYEWSILLGTSRGSGDNVFYNTRVSNGVATPSTDGCYCNETQAWEIGVEGPLISWGQRDVRLAAGFGGRRDEYADISFIQRTSFEGEQRSRFAYGELSFPVVGSDNARPGIQRLEFSAAVRTEDYDSFGRVTTPKLGVIYDPSSDFTLKATWGRSFKTPTLMQRFFGQYTYLWGAQQVGCASCVAGDTVLMSFGANPDLDPERARTWTASVAFHPEALPGLDAELTYFSIDYTQRVAYPIPVLTNSLRFPDYAPFVQYDPTIAQQQALIASYNDAFYNLAGTAYDPNRVVAIISAEYTNVAGQHARGLDLTGSYRFDLASGQLLFRGGVSWIDLSQQNLPGQDAFDLSGTVFFPAELNGRLGVVWSRGGLSLSGFANYTSGVTSTITATPEKTASFTTFDTTLRYETSPGDSPLSGVALALSVDNLFNRAPPGLTQPNPRFAPYDSTNYSAIGRYVTVSISKNW